MPEPTTAEKFLEHYEKYQSAKSRNNAHWTKLCAICAISRIEILKIFRRSDVVVKLRHCNVSVTLDSSASATIVYCNFCRNTYYCSSCSNTAKLNTRAFSLCKYAKIGICTKLNETIMCSLIN